MLATCSGASPHIGIYSLGVSNMLGGYTFYIIDGAPSSTSTSARHILARVRHCLQQAFDNNIAYSKHSTLTLTAASIRQRHRLQQVFDNIITMV
jgi:hypothetical protein